VSRADRRRGATKTGSKSSQKRPTSSRRASCTVVGYGSLMTLPSTRRRGGGWPWRDMWLVRRDARPSRLVGLASEVEQHQFQQRVQARQVAEAAPPPCRGNRASAARRGRIAANGPRRTAGEMAVPAAQWSHDIGAGSQDSSWLLPTTTGGRRPAEQRQARWALRHLCSCLA
jgi:hypothetical protein